MTEPTTRRRRGPVLIAVRKLNEAAASAHRAGLTMEEFIGSALWAASLNEILNETPDAGTTNLFNLSAGWSRVERKMEAEEQS